MKKIDKLILASVIVLGLSTSSLGANAADYTGGYPELIQALSSDGTTDLNRTFTQTEDVSLGSNLPYLTPNDSTLTVDGKSYGISANGYSVFKLNYDRTNLKLNLSNVGSVDLDGNITSSIHGATNALDNFGGRFNVDSCVFTNSSNSAVRNFVSLSNTSTISNSVFDSNNSSSYSGGAIANGSNLIISDSLFTNNSSNADGGAIYSSMSNADSAVNPRLEIVRTVFDSNQSGQNGGAVFNSFNTGAYNSEPNLLISHSEFINNSASSRGGALNNQITIGGVNAKADFLISDSTFTANSSNGLNGGGAIYNYFQLEGDGSNVTQRIENSEFTGNNAFHQGAAISNTAVASGNDSNLDVLISNSTFDGNNLSMGQGGAIYNYLVDNSGSNKLSLTIKNSTFINNHADMGFGGAIYNEDGNLNIVADGADTVFTGNYDNSGSNAIYMQYGTLNINAGNGGSVIFNDGITCGSPGDAYIYVNNSYDAQDLSSPPIGVPTGGVVDINSSVTNLGLYLYDGTLNFNSGSYLVSEDASIEDGTLNFNSGSNVDSTYLYQRGGVLNVNSGSTISSSEINIDAGVANINQGSVLSSSYLYLSDGVLNIDTGADLSTSGVELYGGVLSLENNRVDDVLTLDSFYSEEFSGISFDADLSTGQNDMIFANSAGGILNVARINIVSEGDASTLTLFGNEIAPELTRFAAYTNNYRYGFTQSSVVGVYDIAKTARLTSGIHFAIEDTSSYRSFSATEDVIPSYDLGQMQGDNSTLDLFGNGYSFNGAGVSGLISSSGQSVNIDGFGALNPDGSVSKSINGFYSIKGGFIKTSGNLSISNSVFENNTSKYEGGVVYKELISSNDNVQDSFLVSNSAFVNNTSEQSTGGAIYQNVDIQGANASSMFEVRDSIFDSNAQAIDRLVNIVSDNAESSFIISDSTFLNNYQGVSSNGTVSNIMDVRGQNNALNTVISNSDFDSNVNALSNQITLAQNHLAPGVLKSEGSILITDSTFTNNSSSLGSAALSNYVGIYGNSEFNVNIQNTLFDNNIAQSIGGANYNNLNSGGDDSVLNFSVLNSQFTNNGSQNSNGGAIYNDAYITGIGAKLNLEFLNVTFDSNSAKGIAGAMANYLTISRENNEMNVVIADSIFTNNNSQSAEGGAIFNYLVTNGSDSKINVDINNTVFELNHSSTGGGAISSKAFLYNSGNEIIQTISNSSFVGNYSNGNGGAINNSIVDFGSQNKGYLAIKNSTFTGNHSEYNRGGAIYNQSGTLCIIADGANTVFSGNTDSTGSNAIYLLDGQLYLNAGNGGSLIFDDAIEASNIGYFIRINEYDYHGNTFPLDSPTNGTVYINNDIKNAHVGLYGGTLKLSHDSDLSTSNLSLYNGVLDLLNNRADDELYVQGFSNRELASLRIDADFSTGQNDKIFASNFYSGRDEKLGISRLNILADGDVSSMTLFANEIAPELRKFAAFTNDYRYSFTQSSTVGVYDVSRMERLESGLHFAVEDSALNRSFSSTGDFDVLYDLGQMQGDNSTLDIFGNGYNINGNGFEGILVSKGQTLNIDGVGSLNPDGSVNTSWNGHFAERGSVITNTGENLNILNSVFYNNEVSDYGGVIDNYIQNDTNNSNLSTTISGSTFDSNHSVSDAGVLFYYIENIASNGTFSLLIDDSTFRNNYSETSYGGAFVNYLSPMLGDNSRYSTLVTNSTFDSNHSLNYGGAFAIGSFNHLDTNTSFTTIVDNSVFTHNYSEEGNGGAISIYNGTEFNGAEFNVSVLNSSFINNYAIEGYGGALDIESQYDAAHSSSVTNISNSTFDSNYSFYDGGAVYNRIYRTGQDSRHDFIVQDSTFTNNYSSDSNGGALYSYLENSGANTNALVQVSNTTFDSNHSLYDAGASYIRVNSYGADSEFDVLISDSTFINNTSSNGSAGALNLALSTSEQNNIINVNITDSIFDGNTSQYDGGALALYASVSGVNSRTNIVISNTIFENNSSIDGYGGALANLCFGADANSYSSLTIKNATFTNNSAINGLGGAISQGAGTLNIIADGADSIFSGNSDSTGSNAIRMQGGVINLNAGANNSVIFNDSISASNISNTININKLSTGLFNEPPVSTPVGGTIEFNNEVIGATVNLYNGTLKLGHDSSLATSDLNLYGGILNLQNNRADDVISINNFNSQNSASLYFDADFENGINDYFVVNNDATGTLNIGHLNILADGEVSSMTLFADEKAPVLNSFNAFTSTYRYIFDPATTLGVYDVSRQLLVTSAINMAVSDTSMYRSFSATESTDVASALGNMGGSGSTLDIFGNQNNINGLGYAGVNVLSGQTLNIAGVGSLNKDGTVNTSWNGFHSSNNGAGVNNSGILNVSNSVFKNNESNALGGVIYNTGSLDVQNSRFVANDSNNAGGAIFHNRNLSSATMSVSNSVFENNTATNQGGAISSSINDSSGALNLTNNIIASTFNNNTADQNTGGALHLSVSNAAADAVVTNNIVSSVFTQNKSLQSSGGAIANLAASNTSGSKVSTNISNSVFTSNNAFLNGGAILSDGGVISVANSLFSNNTAQTGLGGAIYATNNSTVNIIANGANTVFSSNTDSTGSNAIHLQSATMNLNSGNGGAIKFDDKITSSNISNVINVNKTGATGSGNPPVAAPTSGLIYLNNSVSNSTVNMYNGSMYLAKDNYLDGNNLNIYGGNINMANNTIGTMALNNLSLQGNSSMSIDADLINGVADRITSANAVTSSLSSNRINIDRINMLNDATKASTNIVIADANVRDYIALGQTTAQSPIYQYNISYNSSGGNLNFASSGFTPSIIGSPVAASTGTYLTQVNMYQEALSRTDAMMFMPQSERLLLKHNNKYASAGNSDQFVFSPTMLPESRAGIWFKQFTTFENVPLNNGPNVSNVVYGMLVGADSEMRELRNGFSGYLTAYAGYTGSHQNYNNVGSYQNGGLVGLTGTVYKGNFFASLTANTGANNGNNQTMYGTDNFTTITAGAAAKVGYNFEFLKGKLILQPTYTMSYTFADTFDYTAASGANITSSPLNAIQITPGLKIIGNLKNGWQPYLGVNMVWNIMDSTKFYANDVQLPQLSVAPYVEYGVGVQRKWGDRFTGFGQAMARGGGRNGVALQFGFRYAIGK